MTTFGNQIRYVASVFDARARPVDAGGGHAPAKRRAELAGQYAKVIMQILVSVAVLAGGFWLLMYGNEAQQKFASGFIGTVLGYWLK